MTASSVWISSPAHTMDKSRLVWRTVAQSQPSRPLSVLSPGAKQKQPWICTQCQQHVRQRKQPPFKFRQQQRRHESQTPQPADQAGFTSIVDNPPIIVRAGRRHNRWGLAVLAAIPITAFALGCWQVQRLGWKSELIAQLEDRILRDPLPLPPQIDPDVIKDFDFRRVYARGRFRHDQEMLLGPRLHDGEDGYIVITPLARQDEFRGFQGNATILINRGWIPKNKAQQSKRPDGLPEGDVVVQGLLREPLKKNMFTPENDAEGNKWYFPDVEAMATHAGSQVVLVEETMRPDLLATYDRIAKGIPIGRPAEVNMRNKHAEYIFTWFSLAAATSVMLWMVVRKPTSGLSRRVRQNTQW